MIYLLISCTASAQSEPLIPLSWTSGVSSDWSPFPHSSQWSFTDMPLLCSWWCLFCSKPSNAFLLTKSQIQILYESYKDPIASTFLIIWYPSILPNLLGSTFSGSFVLWLIQACFHFRTFALTTVSYVLVILPYILDYLFSHFIQVPVLKCLFIKKVFPNISTEKSPSTSPYFIIITQSYSFSY